MPVGICGWHNNNIRFLQKHQSTNVLFSSQKPWQVLVSPAFHSPSEDQRKLISTCNVFSNYTRYYHMCGVDATTISRAFLLAKQQSCNLVYSSIPTIR